MPFLKKKRYNNQPTNWLLSALATLLAVLFIFSRDERAARRANIPNLPQPEAIIESHVIETPTEMEPQSEMPIESIALELLMGKVDPATNPLFVPVESRYASRSGMFMHRHAYEAFKQMHAAAAADGINLVIVSAMRTFNHQRRIWNDKWNGRQMLEGNINATSIANPLERAREILRFSAMPGTSRHHWGTDIDLNSVENSYFESGQGEMVYHWLQQNAARFGFCQPYTARGNNRMGGYEEEKWHWSYKPVSDINLKAFIHYVGYEQIDGFNGWKTAREIGVIENYVMQINFECKSLTN